MLYGIVVFIHVIVCFVLIGVILLQAGRGGGLAEPFGGSTTKTLFGTKAATFLTRATTVSAVVFILTCLTLGVLSTRQNRSLIDRGFATQLPGIPSVPPQAATAGETGQAAQAAPAQVPDIPSPQTDKDTVPLQK